MKTAIADNRLLGLWRIIRGYQLHYVMAIIAIAIATAARTATMLLVRYFVDDVLPSQNFAMKVPPLSGFDDLAKITPRTDLLSVIPFIALGFFALALVQGGFTFISGRLSSRAAEEGALRLRNYLFDHIQRLSFTYHDRMQTGELLARCTSDVESVRRFFSEEGVGVGRIVLLFLINFIAIMFIHVPLALFSVIVVPLVFAISIYFFRRISDKYEAFQDQEAKLSTTLQDNLSGVRVVKAFARQPFEIDKFEEENIEKYRRGKSLTLFHAFYWPLTDVLTGLQMLAGYLAGALLAIHGTLTPGDYLAYAGMLIWIIFPMRNLGRLIVQMSTGLVSYDRVMEIIKETREPLGENLSAPVDELRGEVEFRNVWFDYGSEDMSAVKDVSFHCKAGQTVALLGSTGSGKTSLVNLLPRFYDYTSGSILLDGVELREFPRDFLRRNIGIVQQEPFLFSRTIRENITYGVNRDVTEEDVYEAARAAAVHEVIMEFPDGYDTMVGERGVTLSGGQKQRVTLARTLLKNPKLLILDDATSSVDTETEASIREALNRLMDNRTSFIIAHRIQTVMYADLILVMDGGRIVQMGTHAELLEEDGVYKQTYEMQSRIETEIERELSNV
jgi:ATP-binding cassette subfamily B protein